MEENKPTKEKGFYYAPKQNEDAIDYLRCMVKFFDGNNESINSQYTVSELLNIFAAARKCDWDFYPDDWSRKQRARAAKNATPPQFNDDESPKE